MDYADEQAMELEALEAILGEDGLKEYTGTFPSGWSEERTVHKILVKPDLDDGDASDLSFDLLFQHTDMYPEEVPHLKVSNTRGLSDGEATILTRVMNEEAEANVGMSSIFAVLQAAKAWLENKEGLAAEMDPATIKKQQEEAQEKLRLEQRSHGTPVNEKTFAEWRVRFDREMAEARQASGEAAAAAEKATRQTGRAWFEEKDRPEPLGDGDESELDFSDSEGSSGEELESGDDDEDADGSDEDFLDVYLEQKA